jgi:hypothetical protein
MFSSEGIHGLGSDFSEIWGSMSREWKCRTYFNSGIKGALLFHELMESIEGFESTDALLTSFSSRSTFSSTRPEALLGCIVCRLVERHGFWLVLVLELRLVYGLNDDSSSLY